MRKFDTIKGGVMFEFNRERYMRLLRPLVDGRNAVSLDTGKLAWFWHDFDAGPVRIRKSIKRPVVKSRDTFNAILGHAIMHAQVELGVAKEPQGTAIYWDDAEGWRMLSMDSYNEPSTPPLMPWTKPEVLPFAIVEWDGTMTPGPAWHPLENSAVTFA